MIAALALLAIALSAPVQYELKLDKTQYKIGEPILATLTAKNASSKPVVLMKALWDGAPAASAKVWLEKDGKPVETYGESSAPLVQVMVNPHVSASRFFLIEPGKTVTIAWMKFQGEWDFGTMKTRDKSAYAKAKQKPLAEGDYRCVATYQFDRAKIIQEHKNWNREPEFGPGAERLWKEAVTANVWLNKTVTIRP